MKVVHGIGRAHPKVRGKKESRMAEVDIMGWKPKHRMLPYSFGRCFRTKDAEERPVALGAHLVHNGCTRRPRVPVERLRSLATRSSRKWRKIMGLCIG